MSSRSATHKDLGYRFECTTCSPPSSPTGDIVTPVHRKQEVGHADAETAPRVQDRKMRIGTLLNDSYPAVNESAPGTRLGKFESPRSDRRR